MSVRNTSHLWVPPSRRRRTGLVPLGCRQSRPKANPGRRLRKPEVPPRASSLIIARGSRQAVLCRVRRVRVRRVVWAHLQRRGFGANGMRTIARPSDTPVVRLRFTRAAEGGCSTEARDLFFPASDTPVHLGSHLILLVSKRVSARAFGTGKGMAAFKGNVPRGSPCVPVPL